MNVVITIPIYKKEPSYYELVSLQQAFKVFHAKPIKFVTHRTLDLSAYSKLVDHHPDFRLVYFEEKYFKHIEAYNRLLISKCFYQSFANFQYILIYQTDCFVFSDDLDFWCKQGYDYIGAPLFEGRQNSLPNSDYAMGGNGGFSLRKVSSHLSILKVFKRIKSTKQYFRDYNKMNWKGKLFHFPSQIFGYLFKNNFHHYFNDYNGNEDVFWSHYVPKKFLWFKVAPVSEALKFGMEVQPRRMFKDNGNKLPFGCHAWWRYDLKFWKPYIEKKGYKLE